MTRQELQAIVDNPLSDEQQRSDAQTLLDKPNSKTSGFDSLAEMWAGIARRHADPALRAKMFEDLREKFKGDPTALRSFTPERENLKAKRNVYDQHGGDVIGAAFDEDIPLLFQKPDECQRRPALPIPTDSLDFHRIFIA